MTAICRAQKVSDNHASLQIDWDGLDEAQQKDHEVKEMMAKEKLHLKLKIHCTIENGYLL